MAITTRPISTLDSTTTAESTDDIVLRTNAGTRKITAGNLATSMRNSVLPSQTGNSGKLLITDGTNASFSSVLGGFKNAIINGEFLIAQRADTSNVTGQTYSTVDRWKLDMPAVSNGYGRYNIDDGKTSNDSNTIDTSDRSLLKSLGINSAYYITINGVNASGPVSVGQFIENVHTFAGQTVTLSFYARTTNATVANSPYIRQIRCDSGNSSFYETPIRLPAQTIQTTWARYSYTFNLPQISGVIETGYDSASALQVIPIAFDGNNGSGFLSSNTVMITGVQLELGSIATDFEKRSFAIERQMCLRYYWKSTSYYLGRASAPNAVQGQLEFPVSMRHNIALGGLTFSGTAITEAGSSGIIVTQSTNSEFMLFGNSSNNWSVGTTVRIDNFAVSGEFFT